MNALNRLIMLIVALLLIGVPVLLLLVGSGYLSADLVNAYTRYRDALDALSGFSASDFEIGNQVVVGIVGFSVALVALLLLLREISLGRRVARRAFLDGTPGRETAVTAQAVRHLVEGVAREAGAVSPTCYLASEKRRYNVSCNILVPRTQHLSELATRARENIQRILEEQQVPITDVEVTVQGTASQE
ncbi:MAG: alkaline shock response membrane anchor protein AmaP [Actinomycetota bacterium]|nr:alkaline shock response membrane anchor protein AmaP [Actinomycetota bacterium]